MNRISRITRRLSARIGLGYLGTLISLLFVLLSVFAVSSALSHMTTQLERQELPTLSLQRELMLQSDFMRRMEDNYLDRPWERELWLRRFDAYSASTEALLGRLASYATTPERQRLLGRIERVREPVALPSD